MECWYEYDINGKRIHEKGSDGHEWWSEYDENGNEIYRKNSDGEEYCYEYKFYDDGKIKVLYHFTPTKAE